MEYSLLLVLLAIAVLTATSYLGKQLDSNLDDSGNEISTAVG